MAEQFETSFCLFLLEPYSQRMASAPVQEGEEDQRHYYKKLQLCTEILFPYLAFLSVTLRCPASGVNPGSGKEQGGLHLALGINFVCTCLLEKDLQKCVHCSSFFFKKNPISPLCTVIYLSPLHTAQVLIKELIYSVPQQWTTTEKVPICCISSNSYSA